MADFVPLKEKSAGHADQREYEEVFGASCQCPECGKGDYVLDKTVVCTLEYESLLKIRKDHERLLTALHRGGINHKVLNQLMYGEYSTYRTSMKGDWIEDVPDWSTTTNHGDVDPSASPTTQKRVFADYMSAALSPKPTSAHIATRVKQLQATLSAYKLDEDSKESPTSSGDESEDGHGSVDEQDIDIATKQQDHVDPDVNAGDFDKSDDGGVRLHMT